MTFTVNTERRSAIILRAVFLETEKLNGTIYQSVAMSLSYITKSCALCIIFI